MVVCVGVYGYVYGRVNQSRESNPGNQEIESSSIVESKTKYSSRRWKSEPDIIEKIVRLHTLIKFLSKILNFLENVRWDIEPILLRF